MSKHGQGSDTFTCSVDGVSACSKAPQADILFSATLWQSVIGLCERFNTEWMAYLIGVKQEDGDYEIKSLEFPEQTAGGEHVRREPDANFRPPAGTVGVIHSHVAMQAFFSNVDKQHANWPVEIVVNRKGEYEVSTRVQLPCGDSMRRTSRVLLLTDGQLDAMEVKLKEALKRGKAKEPKQSIVVWPPYDHSEGHGGYGFGGRAHGYGPSWQGTDGDNSLQEFTKCSVCGSDSPRTCPHSITEMRAKVSAEKAVAP